MSSLADRLLLIHEAFSKAYERRLADLKEASSNAEADSILQHVDSLETQYLLAARRALDANGDAVESAYTSAQSAQALLDSAYRKAKSLAERIRLAADVVKNVSELVSKAAAI